MDEQRIWAETQKANMHGVKIDVPLVNALKNIRDEFVAVKSARFEKLTGLEPTQTIAFRDWLMDEHMVNLPNLQKGTIEDALENDTFPAVVYEALTIRIQAAQVASKKLDSMLLYANGGDRIHDLLVYYGAATGRWAGRGPQPQNYPRGAFKVDEVIDPEIFLSIDTWDIDMIYGVDPMTAVGTMLRACLIADDGHQMFDADYSAIEAVTLAYLSGCEKMLERFRGDGLVYEDMATQIFNCDILEVDDARRFVGKTAILGCGYQVGAPKFHEMCINFGRDIGEDLAKHTVETYRSTYPEVPAFWKSAQEGVKSAIRNKGKVFKLDRFGRVLAQSTGRYLYIKLPSGRCITYSLPRVEMVEKVFNEDEGPKTVEQIVYRGMDSYTRKWKDISTYGGSLVESIVQGTARDLMATGMFRTIDAGYTYLFTVHDQIVSQRATGRGDLGEYLSLMCQVPEWAEGLPLRADGKIAHRFSK